MIKLFVAIIITGLLLLLTNGFTTRTFILDYKIKKDTITRECKCHKMPKLNDKVFTKSMKYYKPKSLWL